MVKKTKKAKFSTITAIVAAIAVMSTMGIIGGAGQQVASATILDLDDVVDDEDCSGTDDSIIVFPDVSWITPEISSRIPDVDSIIVWPDFT